MKTLPTWLAALIGAAYAAGVWLLYTERGFDRWVIACLAFGAVFLLVTLTLGLIRALRDWDLAAIYGFRGCLIVALALPGAAALHTFIDFGVAFQTGHPTDAHLRLRSDPHFGATAIFLVLAGVPFLVFAFLLLRYRPSAPSPTPPLPGDLSWSVRDWLEHLIDQASSKLSSPSDRTARELLTGHVIHRIDWKRSAASHPGGKLAATTAMNRGLSELERATEATARQMPPAVLAFFEAREEVRRSLTDRAESNP